MTRAEAEKQQEEFRHAHSCRHYKPYIWNCILVEEKETHEWIIEVYLKRPLPKNLVLLPPPGMKVRCIICSA